MKLGNIRCRKVKFWEILFGKSLKTKEETTETADAVYSEDLKKYDSLTHNSVTTWKQEMLAHLKSHKIESFSKKYVKEKSERGELIYSSGRLLPRQWDHQYVRDGQDNMLVRSRPPSKISIHILLGLSYSSDQSRPLRQVSQSSKGGEIEEPDLLFIPSVVSSIWDGTDRQFDLSLRILFVFVSWARTRLKQAL